MRKRRVGVTARSRQIVGNQATGSLQIDTEMAAPLELRTPTGTAAEAANRVRMEAWRQWRWSQLAESNSSEEMGTASACAERGAPKGAHWTLDICGQATAPRPRSCQAIWKPRGVRRAGF